ncbi:MAG: hypothetical protein Q4D76_16410, partial [Oscillospiraceae bacterium]|nr:hypothetical protein [Oscillospiraceae bacterium]
MGLTLSELEKNDSTFRVLKEFFKPENDVVTETYSDEKHESENKSDNDSDNFQVNAVTPFYFNYEELLAKYNRDNIDNSVIKYSNAVSNWVTELMNIICNFEEEKSGVICHCSELIRSYNIPCNNEIQRIFVEKHQSFLNDTFSFERKIHSLKNAFTRLNSEVIKLKSELKSSLFSDDVFKNLSIVEKKDRPSFVIIAESTANEVKKIIEEINSFENDNSFIENCIGIINSWVRRYCDFISVIPDDNCLKKVIEKTYDLLIPLIEREYSRGIVSIQEDEITISEKIIAELEVY